MYIRTRHRLASDDHTVMTARILGMHDGQILFDLFCADGAKFSTRYLSEEEFERRYFKIDAAAPEARKNVA